MLQKTKTVYLLQFDDGSFYRYGRPMHTTQENADQFDRISDAVHGQKELRMGGYKTRIISRVF